VSSSDTSMRVGARHSVIIARHSGRLLMADGGIVALMLVMPVVMMAFLQPVGRASLRDLGYADASGAEQVVPGMAVMFGFFAVMFVSIAFFREHDWGTWHRLRASQASSVSIMLGKLAPPVMLLVGQLTVLFVAGAVLFGLPLDGSPGGLLLITVALVTCLGGLGLLVTAMCGTLEQVSSLTNLASIVLPGLGGALAPTDALPQWAQTIAPISPAYWALRGYHRILLDDGGVADVAANAGVLLGVGIAAFVLAARRFSLADVKRADL
jgi:ABC-2 type transport system permease protein